jgi:serine/threonine protein kinase
MPGENGLELTQWIRQQDENLSVVLLTAFDQKEIVKESLRAGVVAFVEKPLQPEAFVAIIRSAVARTLKYRKIRRHRYRVDSQIGSGGLGQVYRAWDYELQRFVALKRIHTPARLPSHDPQQLFGEAIRLAQLQHPNIVHVFDCGVDADGPFLVMELLQGQTLDQAVRRSPAWPETWLVDLAGQCLDALIAAHTLDLIHLDIKPSNIMVTDMPGGSFHVKILDFGLARFLEPTPLAGPVQTGAAYGSPLYLAPERIRGEPGDGRTDLYSLGCSLYLAAARRDGFAGADLNDVLYRHLQHDVRPLEQVRPDLAPAFCAWIMRLIQANPEDRPASALAAKMSLAR